MIKKALVIPGMLILASLLFTQCTPAPEGLAVGRKAPAFQLADLDGKEVALEQFKGRIVMLDFWATWCAPCRQSMPMLENLQKEFANNLSLLAINIEEPRDEVRNYVKLRNIRSTVLLDQQGVAAKAYQSNSIPMQVLIDQQGIVRHIQVGFGPSVPQELRAQIAKLL